LKILEQLGVEDRPRIHVLNKIDRLTPGELGALKEANTHANGNSNVFTSGLTGEGLADLLARIDERLPIDPLMHLRLRVPMTDGRHLSLVNATGRVLRSELSGGNYLIEAELPQSTARRLNNFILQ
jgi:GTP-binding protein HflX